MVDDGQHRHAIYERRTALVSNFLLQFWATIYYFTAGAFLSHGEIFLLTHLVLFGRSKNKNGHGHGTYGSSQVGRSIISCVAISFSKSRRNLKSENKGESRTAKEGIRDDSLVIRRI